MERIAKSKLFDLLGVILVVGIAIASGYLTETLAEVTNWGSWARWVPFGLISIGNSVLSIYSTRLTGRMNNVGNWIGIINAVLSGTIDYLLGGDCHLSGDLYHLYFCNSNLDAVGKVSGD